jgi:hypothetical protein
MTLCFLPAFPQINISKVEDLQDDMSDLLEQAEEVQNALSRSYATDDVDEADLEVRTIYLPAPCLPWA